MALMDQFKSDFLHTLQERGFIHQQTDAAGLDAAAQAGVVTAYIGFDATADSLHVGNLVGIMLLRRLQQAGHRPIVLMGGGTTRVGDPSGKDETRQLLSEAQINANIESIREIFSHYLRFDDSPTGAIMANNDDWLGKLEYIPFLRDIGRHFTINRMLTMDSVKLRLEQLKDAEINEAKKILANSATRLCHGEAAAIEVAATAAQAFAGTAAEGLPTYLLKAGETPTLIDVAVALGMAASRGEARRLIEQGGVRLNDEPARSIMDSVSAADLDSGGTARLTVGKKRHGLIRRA